MAFYFVNFILEIPNSTIGVAPNCFKNYDEAFLDACLVDAFGSFVFVLTG